MFSAVKWYVTIRANLTRESDLGLQSIDAAFRSHTQTVCNLGDIDFSSMQNDLIKQLYTCLGSGWSLLFNDDFVVHVARYIPLIGSSYIKLPKFLLHKNACNKVKTLMMRCVLNGRFSVHCILIK